MIKILFVCTGNTCRSPIAAAVFNNFAIKSGIPVFAESAGISASSRVPMSDNAAKALAEIGIDNPSHLSRPIQLLPLQDFKFFIGLTSVHNIMLQQFGIPQEKIIPMTEDVPDPYGENLDAYRLSLQKIQEQVYRIIAKVKNTYEY